MGRASSVGLCYAIWSFDARYPDAAIEATRGPNCVWIVKQLSRLLFTVRRERMYASPREDHALTYFERSKRKHDLLCLRHLGRVGHCSRLASATMYFMSTPAILRSA